MSAENLDPFQHISQQVKVLKCFGLWFFIPYPILSVKFCLIILVKIFVGVGCFVIPTGGQIMYLIQIFLAENRDVREAPAIINLVIGELLTSFSLFDLYFRRNLFRQLINVMISTKYRYIVESHKCIFKRTITVSKYLYLVYLTVAAIDVIVHVIIVPGLHGFQSLPLKMELPFINIHKPEYYVYVFIYQLAYKIVLIPTFLTLTSLLWGFMLFTTGVLDVLINKMQNMERIIIEIKIKENCDQNQAFRTSFKDCIRQHKDIIRFIDLIQATFSGQLSLNLFFCACVICTTGAQVFSIESPFRNMFSIIWMLVYMIIMCVTLFVDCYLGDIIKTKGESLSNVAFACPWRDIVNDLKRDVIIFIARSQQPLIISAANVVPITIETFKTVMDWTYKAFAVLNQTRK